MIGDFYDMDTQNIQSVNESSNASTSGYSTSSGQSPATALQADFNNLNLPSNSSSPIQQLQYNNMQNTTPMVFMNDINNHNNNNTYMQYGTSSACNIPFAAGTVNKNPEKYSAVLRINEQPVEKFRFRYKSEMHGTHGSLNGVISSRTKKTYPEVQLCNYRGKAIILCSLFQTNIESPHSHQLVVRQDDTDICDPHKLEVNPVDGYIAEYKNMGIIHTAKKFIYDELIKKKIDRLRFELGRSDLSTKQLQELQKETEKESKEMNLNQVRLCFEAFKVDPTTNVWTRIAAPVYSKSINNRKSAQTGELRIVRSSIATGSVTGGDDLILLVEKVSKKNIKVRFYELDEDEETVWESWARFKECDVHHQYAIVCQTPAYRDKDIENPVEVWIELVRPSDDERSFKPLPFRYKPRDAVVTRKRRRMSSSAQSFTSGNSSMSSSELPNTVQEQIGFQQPAPVAPQTTHMNIMGLIDSGQDFFNSAFPASISEEYNRSGILNEILTIASEDLEKECAKMSDYLNEGRLEKDGTYDSISLSSSSSSSLLSNMKTAGKTADVKTPDASHTKTLRNRLLLNTIDAKDNEYLHKIFQIYDDVRQKTYNEKKIIEMAKEIANIYTKYTETNENGDSLLHEIITNDNPKWAIKTCHILNAFKLNELVNRLVNVFGETPLHYACIHNRPQYIRPLLGMQCDPNLQDNRGNTALHIAIREQYQNCIESFMQNDKDFKRLELNVKNYKGFTAIHLAVRMQNTNAVEKLLKHHKNAALVSTDIDGNNALHMAVLQKNLYLIKCILNDEQTCSDLLIARNGAGYTALELAKINNNNGKDDTEIIRYLTNRNTISNNNEHNNKYTFNNKMIIKEEELSVSSTEDDDDNGNEHTQELTKRDKVSNSIEIDKVYIKQELPDTSDDDHELNNKTECIQLLKPKIEKIDEDENEENDNHSIQRFYDILNDKKKLANLCCYLREEDKWKSLAKTLKLQHLQFLWSDAEEMFNYIKKSKMDYDIVSKAIGDIDKNAFKYVQES